MSIKLKQVIESLEFMAYHYGPVSSDAGLKRTCLIAKEALSNKDENTAHEPVAYAVFGENGNIRIWASSDSDSIESIKKMFGNMVPLYRAPHTSALHITDKEIINAAQLSELPEKMNGIRQAGIISSLRAFITELGYHPSAQSPTLKNPARVGATTFQPGVRVSTLIDRAEREYIAAQSQEVTPSTIGIAAPPEQEPVNQELIYKIDRDICEGEPYDPEKEDAICISHSALLSTLNAALGDESPRLYTSPQSARRAFPMVTRHKSALREFYKKEHIILAAFHGINLSRDLCTYPECNCPIDKADNGGCLFGLKDSNQEQAATVASEPTEKALMLEAKIYMEEDSNQSKSVIEIVGRIYRAMTEAAKEE